MADPKIVITGQFDDSDLRRGLDSAAEGLERLADATDELDGSGAADELDSAGDAAANLGKETKGAKVEVEGAAKALDSTAKTAKTASDGFAGLITRLKALALAYISIQSIPRAIAAARQQEQSERRVAVALGANVDALETVLALTKEIQGQSLFSDEALNEAASQLLNAGTSTDDLASKLRLVADVSSATGATLEEVSRGIASFGSGTAGQLAERIPELRAIAKEGRLASDGIALLQARFSGAAKQIADTDIGRIQKATNSLGDAFEQLGDALASGGAARGIEVFAALANDFAGSVNGLVQALGGGPDGSFEGRVKSIQLAFGDLNRGLRDDLPQVREELRALQDELAKLTDPGVVRDTGALERFQALEVQVTQLASAFDGLAASSAQAREVDLGELSITAPNVGPEIDRLTALLALLQAQVGQSAPIIRSLGDDFTALAEDVSAGRISLEQAQASFSATVEARRASIAQAIADLEAVKQADAAYTAEIDQQIAALRQLDAALTQVANNGFAGLQAQIVPAQTALESFEQRFKAITTNAGSFTNLGADLADGLANGISGLVQVFAAADGSFSAFARNFIRQMIAMIAQALIFRAISGIFSGAAVASQAGLAVQSGINVSGGLTGMGLHSGGWVPGSDPGYDNVPAMLAGQEFVLNSGVSRKLRQQASGFLEALNAGRIKPSDLAQFGGPRGSISLPNSRNDGGTIRASSMSRGGGSAFAVVVEDKQAADRLVSGDGRDVLNAGVRKIMRDQ